MTHAISHVILTHQDPMHGNASQHMQNAGCIKSCDPHAEVILSCDLHRVSCDNHVTLTSSNILPRWLRLLQSGRDGSGCPRERCGPSYYSTVSLLLLHLHQLCCEQSSTEKTEPHAILHYHCLLQCKEYKYTLAKCPTLIPCLVLIPRPTFTNGG